MEWKRFKDEKPNLGDKILIYGPQTDLYFILTTIVYEGKISEAITHWSYFPDQPERLNPETCDHSGINVMKYIDKKSYQCDKCDSIFIRCDSTDLIGNYERSQK
jgi:hypothetical protein